MERFVPEGILSHTQENRNYTASLSSLKDAAQRGVVLEARVKKCGRGHDLYVDLGCMEGVIPREEGAIGIAEGSVRDVALISRVGKPVCFLVRGFFKNEAGKTCALLSRRAAQEACRARFLDLLRPGDVIPARVSHMERFGAFCDVGAGVSALLPIDAISVSRIPHPAARFVPGQEIRVLVRARDAAGRLTLSHKELLGTWEENASRFSVGETVPGVVRSVESYGVFVELTPNLAGLAEYSEAVEPGRQAAVFIKSICPQRMKIKLVIVDPFGGQAVPEPPTYYFTGDHMDRFTYSPPAGEKPVETVFCPQEG